MKRPPAGVIDREARVPGGAAPPVRLVLDLGLGSRPDLADLWGLEAAKRVLEVAAAGGHSLLFVGPTGAGKSLLARCLPGLLPPLSPDEAQAVAETYARAGEPPPLGRPVRCPAASLPPASLFGASGGQRNRRPGEVHLARHGVLILDDLAFLRRSARQALCGMLDGEEAAPCWLVAALRPCPCGGLARPDASCGCPPAVRRRYQARIDGALLDRIDLHAEVPALSPRELGRAGETSVEAAARVGEAHRFRAERQRSRPAGTSLDAAGRDLLVAAVQRLGLSPRAVTRALRIARTIADLAGSDVPRHIHLAEALQYRQPAVVR